MRLHPRADEMLDGMTKMMPKGMALCYPKQIIPPNGYTNPRYAGLSLSAYLKLAERPLQERSHTAGALVTYRMLEHGVPTYFLADQFAEAVWRTELPKDMKLRELKFPLEAMLFALPDSFVYRTIKFKVPFLYITHAPAGSYPKRLPTFESPGIYSVQSDVDRFALMFPIVPDNDYLPLDYTGIYDMDSTVGHVSSLADVVDDTVAMTHRHEIIRPGSAREYLEDLAKVKGIPDSNSPEELELNQQMNAFAMKLIAVLNAAPQVIEYGPLLRAAKEKKDGRGKSALWGPNLIGRTYRILYEGPEQETGVKMRMHWRRGHIRRQHHGYQNKQVKTVWIDPVIVNAPKEDDAA